LTEGVPSTSFAKARGKKTADAVNLVVVGSRAQLIQAFKGAGFKIAAKLGFKSSAREVYDTIEKKSYKDAPVSTQYLFHKPQDLAFELEEGNARKRHHVRFWSIPGHDDAWAGAASEDIGLLIKPTKGVVSHRVSPEIDHERNFVAEALVKSCGQYVKMAHLRDAQVSRLNAQGVRIYTDAELEIISVEKCPLE
jgi:hypothetical protein